MFVPRLLPDEAVILDFERPWRDMVTMARGVTMCAARLMVPWIVAPGAKLGDHASWIPS